MLSRGTKSMRLPDRLQTSFVVFAAVLAGMLAVVAAVKGGTILLGTVALAAVAAALVGFSIRPQDVFVLWLLAAPFLQDVGQGRAQHLARVLFFSSPPLLFGVRVLLERRSVRGSFVDVFPAAYFLFVLASIVITGSSISVTQLFSIVGIGVIVYYFCAFAPLGEGFEQRVLRVFLATSIIVAVLTLIGKLGGLKFGYTADTSSNVARATGPLGDPVYLGTFLGVGFVVALAVLVWSGPSALRRLSIVAAVVTPVAIFLTLTRGPIIAAAVVGSLILLGRRRSRWGAVVAVAAAAIVVIALWGSIASTSLYKDRFSNKTNVQARVLIDKWSFTLAGRKPILGWGYGSFDRVKNSANLSSGSLPRAFGLNYTSHNTFLTILVELGGVGLLLLLVPWLSALSSARRLLTAMPEASWLVVALLGTIGVWVVNAGTVDMRFFPFAWVLPWLAVGLLRRRVLDAQLIEPEPVEALPS
jgi:O-Antigen ligase